MYCLCPISDFTKLHIGPFTILYVDTGFWSTESIPKLLTLEEAGAEAGVEVEEEEEGEGERHLVVGVGLGPEGVGQQGPPGQLEAVGHWNLPILSCCCWSCCSLTGGLSRI